MAPSTQKTRLTSTVDYGPSEQYQVKKAKYATQYAQLYFCRLCALRTAACESAKRKWGAASPHLRYAERIVNIRASESADTVVVGVVFRESSAKPSILAAYNKSGGDHVLVPPPPPRSKVPYRSEDEKVIIEDENGRCVLDISSLPSSRLFTSGIVLAVRGKEDLKQGVFVANDVTVIGPAPQKGITSLAADRWVAFVSAPVISGSNPQLELLLEFIRGTVTDAEDAQNICKVVVTGPLIAASSDGNAVSAAMVKEEAKPDEVSPLVELDRFLTATAATVPTAVLPGEGDPVNYLMPQQPLHRCLLPSASRSNNLKRVTNPVGVRVDERLIVGTSGQPVSDMVLYGTMPNVRVKKEENVKEEDVVVKSENGAAKDEDMKMTELEEEEKAAEIARVAANDVLGVLETQLESRHIAPTCPDTVASYPFHKDDPFILSESPHILFAGNQKQFATKMYGSNRGVYKPNAKGVQCRLLALPRFCDTGRIVLVSLNTLHCSVREFSTDL